MSFVSSANLPSYFRGDPGNRTDRPTSFGRDVFIRRILNKEVIKLKFSCTILEPSLKTSTMLRDYTVKIKSNSVHTHCLDQDLEHPF